MSDLATLQHDFLAAFNQQDESLFTDHINSKTDLSPQQRFAIYNSSITEAIATSMRHAYPACEKLVGEDFFNGMVYSYIKQTPSNDSDISNYGENFAEYVVTFPPAKPLPYLADICRLSWAYHRLYSQLPDAAFDIQAFGNLNDTQQAQVIFQLKPNAILLSSPYPLTKIWDLSLGKSNDDAIDLQSGGVNVLLWRADDHVQIDELSDDEYTVAQALQNTGTLDKLTALPCLKGINFAELIPAFLTHQWIGSFSVNSTHRL
ncbi:MAG: DNA-binding domain-containing protein [Coxiellaceae bacterium]|nr:DNA-binding domain-containing protein [Coxiellaceae bacterium]